MEDTLCIVLDPVIKKKTNCGNYHLIYSSESPIKYSNDYLTYVENVNKEEI